MFFSDPASLRPVARVRSGGSVFGAGVANDLEDWPVAGLPAHVAADRRRLPVSQLVPAGSVLRVSPCHRLDTGGLCGAEAVLPGPVLPHAAAGPTDVAWHLRAACLQAQAWRSDASGRSRPAVRVTVALPPHASASGTLVAQVAAALDGAGLPAALLDLALDGADLACHGADLLLRLSALRDIGVGVSMGGVAKVPYGVHALRRLPLTGLRLDVALVRSVTTDAEARAQVAMAVRQAHAAEASVVALGVATPMQRDILADLGCNAAQGPFFAPLLRPETFQHGLALQ